MPGMERYLRAAMAALFLSGGCALEPVEGEPLAEPARRSDEPSENGAAGPGAHQWAYLPEPTVTVDPRPDRGNSPLVVRFRVSFTPTCDPELSLAGPLLAVRCRGGLYFLDTRDGSVRARSTLHVGGGVEGLLLPVEGGVILGTALSHERKLLLARVDASGASRWVRRLDAHGVSSAPPVIAQEHLYVVGRKSDRDVLFVVELESGAVLGSHALPLPAGTWMSVRDGEVVLAQGERPGMWRFRGPERPPLVVLETPVPFAREYDRYLVDVIGEDRSYRVEVRERESLALVWSAPSAIPTADLDGPQLAYVRPTPHGPKLVLHQLSAHDHFRVGPVRNLEHLALVGSVVWAGHARGVDLYSRRTGRPLGFGEGWRARGFVRHRDGLFVVRQGALIGLELPAEVEPGPSAARPRAWARPPAMNTPRGRNRR